MAWSRAAVVRMVGVVAALQLSAAAMSTVDGLSNDYYAASCPNLELMVRTAVEAAIRKDITYVAGLLRFHFHDCFPQGCDASILFLDAASTPEYGMPPNRGLLRMTTDTLIDHIHTTVNASCPNTVSCTDIMALATRAAVMNMSVPGYEVPLGRLDSLEPAPLSKVMELPGPDMDAVQLIQSFQSRNFTVDDLVALSGAHTIGVAQCKSFRNRKGESAEFVQKLRDNCANKAYYRQDLDVTTPNQFDNKYFSNLQEGKGVLNSDMALTKHTDTSWRVDGFAQDQGWFFSQFSSSMSKLAHLQGDQGRQGEIRKYSCNFSNKWVEEGMVIPGHVASA